MLDHVDRYLKSGGTDGHMYTPTSPTSRSARCRRCCWFTKGRKSGEKYLFPLFYGEAGKGYFIVASKGGAPDHPGWYKNILANPEVEVQVGTKTVKARARTVSGAERQKLWDDAVSGGRPTSTTRRRRSARSRWWCSIRCSHAGPRASRPAHDS
jgi:proline iminopeptidase